jgi:hypothetical protein
MINRITKIQLLGKVKGYLDISDSFPVPMTYSVADIRDISKRTGAFSKTIVLPNTKNNARLLGHYFDVNIQAGTFNINKLQECVLLQNNVPVTQNAYIQLVNVKKRQNVQTEDDFVEFEVLIKDNVGDFFTKLGGTLLEQIDLSGFSHSYTGNTIAASFNNTWEDGYKYILPWIDTPLTSGPPPTYQLAEFKPAIYAKQYWDRIHANAGFEYTWDTLTANNVRFDKLLIPYNNDDKKLTQDEIDRTKVIAQNTTQADYNRTAVNCNVGNADQKFFIPQEIQDQLNIYNESISVYNNPFLLASPTGLDLKFEIDYDIIFDNQSGTPKIFPFVNLPAYRPMIRVAKLTANSNINISEIPIGPPILFINQISGDYITLQPGENLIYSNTGTFTTTVTNLNDTDNLIFKIGTRIGAQTQQSNAIQFRNLDFIIPTTNIIQKFRIKSVKMTIALNASTITFGFPINPNSFIPKKVKQSDFIKSICLMYNLFVETDPDNPNRLIYKHRDLFYDTGKVVDWTDKVARNVDQNLKFLPELTSKRLILTYKPDKDLANEVYTNATKEIYGQHEVIFQNEYVKNIETKELIFSPSPVQPTSFGAVALYYNGQSPNTNIRILLDNGQQSCGFYRIQNHGTGTNANFTTLNTYPFVSHMDAEVNPTFDINFGVCDFYFYDILNFTTNNLFYNFWARTMAQIDQGKLFTAYFALSEADIQKMKLNDKIRIDNSWWNINKIVDYDAGSNSLTKVELISIDPGLKLPTFRGTISEWTSPFEPIKPVRPLRPVLPIREIKEVNIKLTETRNFNTSIINSDSTVKLMGNTNVTSNEFRGIVIGDNINAKHAGAGIYVGDWLLKDNGSFVYTGLKIIDGGLDEVMNKMKTNPVDIIDGGLDEVRNLDGYYTLYGRVFIDGNPEESPESL